MKPRRLLLIKLLILILIFNRVRVMVVMTLRGTFSGPVTVRRMFRWWRRWSSDGFPSSGGRVRRRVR